MTAYIRVVDGQIERRYARDHASQMEYKEAEVRQEQAHVKWHDVIWEIEQTGDNKYMVKAERI